MSGVFRAIGKAFKSVVKVIKKVALPVLAIAAVVLTGGAALGALPSLGSIGASLGLSTTLTGILSTAGTSALMGAGVAAVTGQNIIKGATAGFITGGVLGGVSAAANGLGGAMSAAKAGTQAAGAVGAQGASTAAQAAGATASTAAQATGTLAGTVAQGAAPLAFNAATIAPAALPAVSGGGFGGALGSTVGQIGNVAGGALKFIGQNPVPVGMALQGLGSGLAAKAQADAIRDEREAIAANYTASGLFTMPNSQGQALPEASSYYRNAIYGKMAYDPATGRVIPMGG